MKSGSRRYITIGLGLLLLAAIFLADLELPLGVAIWLVYLAVTAFFAWTGDRPWAFILATLSTVLIVLGFFLSPQGVTPWIAAVNRTAGVILIWSAAFVISDRRRLLSRVVQQAEELSAANGRLQQQTEQLTIANDLLQSQAEELEVQAEELQVQSQELQVQNEELLTQTDTLEQTVFERTAELRSANQSLQEMSARLIEVQEHERRAISRELHDESGQLLTSMILRLGVLRNLMQQGERPLNAVDELKQMANQLAEGLHRLAVDLRPASLDRAGLVAALEQYIESYRKTYALQVDLVVDGFDGDRLAPEVESSLYRIVQEGLTNVARHARASHVAVLLNQRSDAVGVIIEDDGIGFDLQAVHGGRLGLTGMHERAELRGGSVTIESQPGVGTTVFVEIPCPSRSSIPPSPQ